MRVNLLSFRLIWALPVAEMASSGPPNTISLKVLSQLPPPDTVRHYESFDATMTVLDLKVMLSNQLSARPMPSHIRLIHQGRVMAKHGEAVGDVLRCNGLEQATSFTIHVVIRDPETLSRFHPGTTSGRSHSSPPSQAGGPPQTDDDVGNGSNDNGVQAQQGPFSSVNSSVAPAANPQMPADPFVPQQPPMNNHNQAMTGFGGPPPAQIQPLMQPVIPEGMQMPPQLAHHLRQWQQAHDRAMQSMRQLTQPHGQRPEGQQPGTQQAGTQAPNPGLARPGPPQLPQLTQFGTMLRQEQHNRSPQVRFMTNWPGLPQLGIGGHYYGHEHTIDSMRQYEADLEAVRNNVRGFINSGEVPLRAYAWYGIGLAHVIEQRNGAQRIINSVLDPTSNMHDPNFPSDAVRTLEAMNQAFARQARGAEQDIHRLPRPNLPQVLSGERTISPSQRDETQSGQQPATAFLLESPHGTHAIVYNHDGTFTGRRLADLPRSNNQQAVTQNGQQNGQVAPAQNQDNNNDDAEAERIARAFWAWASLVVRLFAVILFLLHSGWSISSFGVLALFVLHLFPQMGVLAARPFQRFRGAFEAAWDAGFERSMMLFLASLWPGIGERQIAAARDAREQLARDAAGVQGAGNEQVAVPEQQQRAGSGQDTAPEPQQAAAAAGGGGDGVSTGVDTEQEGGVRQRGQTAGDAE